MLTDLAKEAIARILCQDTLYPNKDPVLSLPYVQQTLQGSWPDDITTASFNYINFADENSDLNTPVVLQLNEAYRIQKQIFVYANKKIVVVQREINGQKTSVILVFDSETDKFLYRVKTHRTYNNPTDELYFVIDCKLNEKTGSIYGLCEKDNKTHFFMIADFWSQYEGSEDRSDVFYNILFDVESEVELDDDEEDNLDPFNTSFALFRTDNPESPRLIYDFNVDFFSNDTYAFTWWDETGKKIWIARFETDLGQSTSKEALWLINEDLVNPDVDVDVSAAWTAISSLSIMTGNTYVDDDHTSVGSILVSTAKGADNLAQIPIDFFDTNPYVKSVNFNQIDFDAHEKDRESPSGKNTYLEYGNVFQSTSLEKAPYVWRIDDPLLYSADFDQICKKNFLPILNDPLITITNIDFRVSATNNKDSNITTVDIFRLNDWNKFKIIFSQDSAGQYYVWTTAQSPYLFMDIYLYKSGSTTSDLKNSTLIMRENYKIDVDSAYYFTQPTSLTDYEENKGVQTDYPIKNNYRDILWYNAGWDLNNVWDRQWDSSKYDDVETYKRLMTSFRQNRPFGRLSSDDTFAPEDFDKIPESLAMPFIEDSDNDGYRDWPWAPFIASNAKFSLSSSLWDFTGKATIESPVEDTDFRVYYNEDAYDTDPGYPGSVEGYDHHLYSSTTHYVLHNYAHKNLDQVDDEVNHFGEFFERWDWKFWPIVDTTLRCYLSFSGYRETVAVSDATTIQYTMTEDVSGSEREIKFERTQVLGDAYDAKTPVFISPNQAYVALKQNKQDGEYGLYFFSGNNDLGGSSTTTITYNKYVEKGVASLSITLVSMDSINYVKLNGSTWKDYDITDTGVEIFNVSSSTLVEISYESFNLAPQMISQFTAEKFSDIYIRGTNNFGEIGTNTQSVVGVGADATTGYWTPFVLWKDNDNLSYLNRVAEASVSGKYQDIAVINGFLDAFFVWRENDILFFSGMQNISNTNYKKLDWQAIYSNTLSNPYPLEPYRDRNKDLVISNTNFTKQLVYNGAVPEDREWVYDKFLLDATAGSSIALMITNIRPEILNDKSYRHDTVLRSQTGNDIMFWPEQQFNKENTELLQLNFNTRVFVLMDKNIVDIEDENQSFDFYFDFAMMGDNESYGNNISNVVNDDVLEDIEDNPKHKYDFRHLPETASTLASWFVLPQYETRNTDQNPQMILRLTRLDDSTLDSDATQHMQYHGPDNMSFQYKVDGEFYKHIAIYYRPRDDDTEELLFETDVGYMTTHNCQGKIKIYGADAELPDEIKKELGYT